MIMPRKRRTLRWKRNISLKSTLPNHSVTSQKKTRWEYFKQRLLVYLIGRLVKYYSIFGRSEVQLEDFAIVMPRQNAFTGKNALEGSAKLPNERIAP
jgi:hypothetical protein